MLHRISITKFNNEFLDSLFKKISTGQTHFRIQMKFKKKLLSALGILLKFPCFCSKVFQHFFTKPFLLIFCLFIDVKTNKSHSRIRGAWKLAAKIHSRSFGFKCSKFYSECNLRLFLYASTYYRYHYEL